MSKFGLLKLNIMYLLYPNDLCSTKEKKRKEKKDLRSKSKIFISNIKEILRDKQIFNEYIYISVRCISFGFKIE